MWSVGKVVPSVLSASQENAFALANLNFDFALFKVEAPIEYKALGDAISKRRRDAAENGDEHVIARKLGALFSPIIPPTPNLIRAYGIRSSEIVKTYAETSSGSEHNGVFKEWTGADATNIWAAATSGPEAIAVHLLACMLANAFPASEAEAIWDEIIQGRKAELAQTDPSAHNSLASELAARIEVTREQISSWDTSTRAWLEVADKLKMRQQKQLRLLLTDCGLPVN